MSRKSKLLKKRASQKKTKKNKKTESHENPESFMKPSLVVAGTSAIIASFNSQAQY